MKLTSARELMAAGGTPVLSGDLPTSEARFADAPDRAWKVEIPSCDGPAVMRAVLAEADARGVRVDRVSQGSGVFMLTDAEITEMVQLGGERNIEVCLFLGPRAAWDTGGQAKVTAAVGGVARGNEQVAASLCDTFRAVDLGVRSVLVGDLGTLAEIGRLKGTSELPDDLVVKTSVTMPLPNAPTAAAYEAAGATSLNVSTDLPLSALAEIRAATTSPIDIYVEVPDDQGGAVRFYEVPEIVRVAAPVYLKLGVRNAPNIYPVGAHLAATAEALGRERARRAELMLRLLAEQED